MCSLDSAAHAALTARALVFRASDGVAADARAVLFVLAVTTLLALKFVDCIAMRCAFSSPHTEGEITHCSATSRTLRWVCHWRERCYERRVQRNKVFFALSFFFFFLVGLCLA